MKIIMERPREFANRVRKIEIYAEDNKVGEIQNGETKEFEIGTAKTVQARIDWCSSNVMQVEEGDKFKLTSFAKHNPFGIFAAIYFVSFAKNKYLRLEKSS